MLQHSHSGPTPRRGRASRAAGTLPIAAALLLFAAPRPAAAVPIREGTMISIDVRDEKAQAYVVQPVQPGFYPGVVVIHEWWGLNDQIKGVADKFAEEGYVAIAPDLYHGKIGTDAGLAHELMRAMNENYAVDVVEAAAAALRAQDAREVRRARGDKMPVATLGFCMGGRVSLATGLQQKDIQAVVMFYGSVETDPQALKPLKVPLLGIFGQVDRGIPPDQVKAFEAALKASGKDAVIIDYPEVGHAFFNETRPSYGAEEAKDAWGRTLAFLKEKLPPQLGSAANALKPAAAKPGVATPGTVKPGIADPTTAPKPPPPAGKKPAKPKGSPTPNPMPEEGNPDEPD